MKIEDAKFVAIDIETTGIDRYSDIYSAAVAWGINPEDEYIKVFLLDPLEHKNEEASFVSTVLEKTLFNPEYPGIVIFHNLNFDLQLLLLRYYSENKSPFNSKQFCKLADTLALSRIAKNNKAFTHVDPSGLKAHSLKYLAKEWLPKSNVHSTFDEATGGLNIRLADRSRILDYNKKDALYTYKIFHVLLNQIDSHEKDYFWNYEMPHILNLFHINFSGVEFDDNGANNLIEVITNQLWELEQKIFSLTKKVFNIGSSSELARAIFFNHDVTYLKSDGKVDVLRPPFRTEKGKDKTSLDAIVTLKNRIDAKISDQNIKITSLLDMLIQYLELSKSLSQIESLKQHAVKYEGVKIFPNYTPDARTGRVRCQRPNLLGLSKKLLNKTNTKCETLRGRDDLTEGSVRKLFKTTNDFNIVAIDIDGADLGVIAHCASEVDPKFEWLEFFNGKIEYASEAGVHACTIDSHVGIDKLIRPEEYKKNFSDVAKHLSGSVLDYWPIKSEDSDPKLFFYHPDLQILHPIPKYLLDPAKTAKRKRERKIIKQLNLGTSYLMGAKTLAGKIQEAIGDGSSYSVEEASSLLELFYDKFAPLRKYQDDLARELYFNGYKQSPFGRKFYADTWDELNEYYKATTESQSYEFICKIKGQYWYLKTTDWCKFSPSDEDGGVLVKNLKLTDKSEILKFKNIISFCELDSETFRQKRSKKKRPTQETSDQDETGFILTKAEITHEVEQQTQQGGCISSMGVEIVKSWVNGSVYSIPESSIVFYRVNNKPNVGRSYFKPFTALIRATKKVFPAYSQGIAATVAKIRLTEIRTRFEKELPEAQILFFIHDEIVAKIPKHQIQLAEEILTESVESPAIELGGKSLRVKFTGSFECFTNRWTEKV